MRHFGIKVPSSGKKAQKSWESSFYFNGTGNRFHGAAFTHYLRLADKCHIPLLEAFKITLENEDSLKTLHIDFRSDMIETLPRVVDKAVRKEEKQERKFV